MCWQTTAFLFTSDLLDPTVEADPPRRLDERARPADQAAASAPPGEDTPQPVRNREAPSHEPQLA